MQSTGNGRRLPAGRHEPGRRATQGGLRRGWTTPWAGSGDTRRWHEVYTSATVILAGVLLVIGFAFVASKAVNSGNDDDLTDSPPAAALPGAGPTGSGSAAPIPIDPAPSGSPSGSPSPSTEKATSKPPDEGAVKIDTGGVPALVDLSAEGTRDWVHWGEQGTFSLERDSGGGFAILEGTPSAPRFRHALSPQRFAWTDGDPVDHSDGTPTGIRTCGKGNGFTVTAPAATTTRVLRLYVGVVSARGRLEARLTAGSATQDVTLEQRDNDFRSAVYTISYRAPRTAKLSLKWTTQESFSDGCGGVALEAATLT